MRRHALLVIFAPLLSWGCGDIIGLDGYTDGDGSLADATNDAQSDAASDVTPPKDGGADVVPTCNLQSSVCVPELPSGWAWAVYDPDARGACAPGYGASTDVEEGIDAGPASCTCGCTTNNPDCHSGTLTITAGTGNTCNNVTNQTDVADSGCNPLATGFTTPADSVAVTPPKPDGGSCAPSGTTTIPGVAYAHEGRTCAYEAGAPGGCDAGEVCLPNPAPFTTCVSQAGAQTCPSGFPNQHTVGSQLDDTRGCTPCGCSFDAGSCAGTLTLWANATCNNNATPITANDTCTSVGNHAWKAYSYVPQTTAACSGTPVAPDGGAVFGDLTTVCCM